MKKLPFWREQNVWWVEAVRRIHQGTASPKDWEDAHGRLWCLIAVQEELCAMSVEDRADAVQEVFVKLQSAQIQTRLTLVDAPAHYLARMLRNRTRSERQNRKFEHKAIRRHEQILATVQAELSPARLAENAEMQQKVRYVVNHKVGREDRQLLWWFYKDGVSACEIGSRLGITEGAVFQRLTRARKHAKEFLEQ